MFTNPRILLLGGGVDDGCGFYRVQEPMRVALDAGAQVEYDDGIDGLIYLNDDGTVHIENIDVKGVDLVVFQRPTNISIFEAIKYLQKRGIACAVETDDDLTVLHRNNMAYDALNPANSPYENWSWYSKSCEIADLVIASTPAILRRQAKHGRGVVIRNRVPESYFEPDLQPLDPDNIRVGWTGTLLNHPEDLQEARSHVQVALGDRDFYVVGDGKGVKEVLNFNNNIHTTGWVPRSDYIETMRNHIDVGIVPLKLDSFNQGKSYLKGLEMASQGIPAVVSSTDEYLLFAEMTSTPVAKKGRDWQKHLKKLLSDIDTLEQRRYDVRESVRSCTYENHVDEWLNAWALAIDNRRKTD